MAKTAESSKQKEAKDITITPGKFALYTVLTLGFYQVYWGWRAWEVVRRSNDETYKIRSSIRAIFLAITGFFLFPRMRDLAKEAGYKSKTDVTMLAAIYFVGSLVAGLGDDEVGWLFLPLGLTISILAVLPIVRMYNHYIEHRKTKFELPTQSNWWLIGFFVVVVTIVILSALVPVENKY